MAYTDIMIAAVETTRRDEYLAYCHTAAERFRTLGAREVVDLWGDEVPEGQVTSLPLAVAARAGETVTVGWITWPDREIRDRAWAEIMSEPGGMGEMPFDGSRMIFGGFTEIARVAG